LFRWFLDMNADEPTFDASSFSRNRERLLDHDVAAKFFAAIVDQARAAHLMSHDHFTVDGTSVGCWPLRRRTDGNNRPTWPTPSQTSPSALSDSCANCRFSAAC
jgi:hypothetical protein